MKAVIILRLVALSALVLASSCHAADPGSGSGLPATGRLSDLEFWELIETLSEPGGFFRSDNFVSNEVPYQHVIPELQRRVGAGGVYLGVGPDQNFTYIVATRPEIAFIVDIRRQNMLQHLLYKALFELAADRVDFLSRLFSRPPPAGLDPDDSIENIIGEFRFVAPEESLFDRNLAEVLGRLELHRGSRLPAHDADRIARVYRAFYLSGPEIRYSTRSRWGWRRFPTYADLVTQSDAAGVNYNYLASPENFDFIRTLHLENRIVPLVGDFAGERCLAAVAEFLQSRRLEVRTFYTSNVEYYLFQSAAWRRFFENVARMPVAPESTFVRSYFNNYGYRHPAQESRYFSVTLLDSIPGLVRAFRDGDLRSYYALIERSR